MTTDAPAWLQALRKATMIDAIEVIGRECKPVEVIVIGRPSWSVFDALVGIETVRTIDTFTDYADPSKVIIGWEDDGDVLQRPIKRPSRAVSLNEKIRWMRPEWEGWSLTCDLVVLSNRDFPFDRQTAEGIGYFVHRMAPDCYVSDCSWEHDFPPKDFLTVELAHGYCGFHPVHVPDKAFFNRTTMADHAGARMDPNRKKGKS